MKQLVARSLEPEAIVSHFVLAVHHRRVQYREVPTRTEPVARLWRLGWNEDWISCAVYHRGAGFEMRLESSSSLIMSEPFELRPRMLARMQALRASLRRRGWQDLPD